MTRPIMTNTPVPMLVQWVVVLLGVFSADSTYARNQDDELKAFSLKAAYIYSFSKFVEWPMGSFNNDQSPLVLCVVSPHERREAWKIIEGKPTQGRQLEIKYIQITAPLKPCHMLFIGNNHTRYLQAILPRLSERPVLTLGDHHAFAEEGGMIGLETENDRVLFSVNLTASKRSGLVISSRLIALASHVVEE